MLQDQPSARLAGRYRSAEGSVERSTSMSRDLLRDIRATLDQAQREAAESQLRLEEAQREQDVWRLRVGRGSAVINERSRTSAVVLEAQKALERARQFREEQLRKQSLPFKSQQQAGTDHSQLLKQIRKQQEELDLNAIIAEQQASVREQRISVKEPQEVLDLSGQQPEEVSDEVSFKWFSHASKGLSEVKRPSRPTWTLSDSSLDNSLHEEEKSPSHVKRHLYEFEGRSIPALKSKDTPSKALPEVRCSLEKTESQSINPTPKKEPHAPKERPQPLADPLYAVPYMYPVPMYQPMPMFSPYYAPIPFSPPGYWMGMQVSPRPDENSRVKLETKTPRKRTLDVHPVARLKVEHQRRCTSESELATHLPPTPPGLPPSHLPPTPPVPPPSQPLPRSPTPDPPKTADSPKAEAPAERPKAELVVIDAPESLSEVFRTHHKSTPEKPLCHSSRHREKTKPELIAIRKEMMKPHSVPKPPGPLQRPEALERLVQGGRPAVSKKEMLELTSKNYRQLPEVKRRLEDEEKKEALLHRLASAKAYARRNNDDLKAKVR